jgi:DNA-binding CsgD family transcriptional regulator
MGRPKGARNRRSIGPWRHNPAEAKALDALLVFGSNEEAAKYLGIAGSTLGNTLRAAYAQMSSRGLDLGEDPRQHRVNALREWLLYWWSDEGKANLRNVLLTAPPQA